MPRIEMARLALASEKPDTCTGLPRLPSPQGAEQEAHIVTADNPWRFLKIAETVAQTKHGARWRMFTDDYLGALVGAFWRNRFPQVFHRYGFGRPDTITREVAWRMLGDARPPAFRGVQEREDPDWEALAEVPAEDYGSGLRNTFLAQLLLPEAEAGEWIHALAADSNHTIESRKKGGSAPKYYVGFQQFLDELFARHKEEDPPLTLSRFCEWLQENALFEEGYETGIPNCDDIEFYDDKVWWKDQQARQKSIALRTAERYLSRAKKRASSTSA